MRFSWIRDSYALANAPLDCGSGASKSILELQKKLRSALIEPAARFSWTTLLTNWSAPLALQRLRFECMLKHLALCSQAGQSVTGGSTKMSFKTRGSAQPKDF